MEYAVKAIPRKAGTQLATAIKSKNGCVDTGTGVHKLNLTAQNDIDYIVLAAISQGLLNPQSPYYTAMHDLKLKALMAFEKKHKVHIELTKIPKK